MRNRQNFVLRHTECRVTFQPMRNWRTLWGAFGAATLAAAGCAQGGARNSFEDAPPPPPPADAGPEPTEAAPPDSCAGIACESGERCCSGGCTTDPTCKLTLTGASSDWGHVGGGAYLELHGSGFKEGIRAYVGDGRAPVRVVDDENALVLTPPAPAGKYDLRVELGGHAASLHRAYTYHAFGFTQDWVKITMSGSRGNFPAVSLLRDGRVLLAGGMPNGGAALATADLYDPATQSTSLASGTMMAARFAASAITLLDGRVLVMGVCNSATVSGCVSGPQNRPLVDTFDPKTNKFSLFPSRMVDDTRFYVRPVLLPDGKVLIVSMNNPTAEILDPEANTITLLSQRSAFSTFGFPARLRDGRIALLSSQGVEIYDHDAHTLTQVAAAVPDSPAAAFTLPDGRVLVPGGMSQVGADFVPSASISYFDPKSGAVSTAPQPLPAPRMKYGGALLRDGTIMIAAGVRDRYPASYACYGNTFPTTSNVDVIDPVAGTVTAFTPLQEPNMELVATTLLDGSVLLAGGSPCGGAGAYPYVYYLQSAPVVVK